MNIPEQIQRRDFIKQLGLASTAALATNGTQAWGNDVVIHPKAKADSCILIWMAGGMAAPDTFDPKRYLPFEKGLEVNKILSTFPAIDTNVDGIKISQGLGKYSSSNGSGYFNSLRGTTRLRIDSSFPTSISLAYRICSSHHRGGPPSRCMDGQSTRSRKTR